MPLPLHVYVVKHNPIFIAIGGSRGGAQGRAPPPLGQIFFIFMQFFGKIGQIVCWRPPPLGLAPPRLGNPGSATDCLHMYVAIHHSNRIGSLLECLPVFFLLTKCYKISICFILLVLKTFFYLILVQRREDCFFGWLMNLKLSTAVFGWK